MFKKIKNLNFKKLARGFAILWMLAFIVVMTITNVGIDPEFNWLKWLGNAMILFGITVFGIYIGESIGVDFQKEKTEYNAKGNVIGGLYQKNLYEYNVFRKAIDGIIIYFPVFYDWLVPQRLDSKQINFLIMNDVNAKKARNIVRYCGSDDLWALKQGAIKKIVDGKEIYIDKLQAHEIEPVEEVLNGRIKLELSGCSYYLQAFATSNQRDILEEGEGYRKARSFNRKSNRAIRLVSGAVISLGLGILTVNDFMRAGEAQAWMNLVTRITNLVTSLLSGWLSGATDVKIEANSIENKTDVLKLFKSAYDKRMFERYDEDEKARKHWEQQEEEKEKLKENVIDPEVVDEDKPNGTDTTEKGKDTFPNNLLENKSNQIEYK